MLSSRYSAAAVAFFSLIASIEAVYDATSNKNLAVYYGQGNDETGLAGYCDAAEIDIIPIGFINKFTAQADGLVQENFGDNCWNGPFYNGTDGKPSPLYTRCPQLQQDLYYCQQSTNKKILLSLGGDTATYQITGHDEGVALAEFLWSAYGPYNETYVKLGGVRPLDRGLYNDDDSMIIDVDGFDFDIEHQSTDQAVGYIACINRLQELFKTAPNKKYLITGAPQCPLPEENMGLMITGAKFDLIWVQFYNNDLNGCSARSWVTANPNYISGVAKQSAFNYDSWTTFLQSGNSSAAKLYIGLPAATDEAASDDYLTPAEAESLISYYQKDSNFGGVMLWEATGASGNVDLTTGLNYYQAIREILDTVSTVTTSSTSSLPTSTSTTSSSSSSVTTPTSTTSKAGSSSATPTPTTVSSVGECKYIGCYSEGDGVRALSGNAFVDYTAMSVEICANFCESWDLFGVEYGGECYCGDSFGYGSKIAAPEECNMPCDGTPTEFCGSGNRLDVYQCAPTSSASSSSTSTAASSTSSASTSAAASSSSTASSSTSAAASSTSSTSTSAAPTSSSAASSSTPAAASSSSSSSSSSAAASSSAVTSSSSASYSTAASSSAAASSSSSSASASSSSSSPSSVATRSSSTPATSVVSSSSPSSSSVSSSYTNSTTFLSSQSSSTRSASGIVTSSSSAAASSSSSYSTLRLFQNSTSTSTSYSSTSSPVTTSPASSSEVSSPTTTEYTVSTVYTTSVYTITSCAATVTNCPARIGQVTTETISLYTTYCPIAASETAQATTTSPAAAASTKSAASITKYTTSTVYTTSIYTITSCAPTVTNCPARIGQITTDIISLYTTICPVTAAAASSTAAGQAAASSSTTTTTHSSTVTSFVTINIVQSTATVVPIQSAPYPTGSGKSKTKVLGSGTGVLPSVSLVIQPAVSNTAKAAVTSSTAAPISSNVQAAGAGSVKVGCAMLAIVAGAMMLL